MDGRTALRSRLGKNRTIANLLSATEDILKAADVAGADLEASFLLGHLLGRNRAFLLLSARETVEQSVVDRLAQYVERRLGHEPLAYILGEWEFWSFSLKVSPAVLIPRKETEVLVEKVLESLQASGQDKSAIKILDLGTGSGALAIALALELPYARVFAVDCSEAALEVASANINRHQLVERVQLIQSDWAAGIAARQQFDLVVSNPPYIERRLLTGEAEGAASGDLLQREVRCSEPMLALDGGPDGFEQIRRIVDSLPILLKPGADFFMEIGSDQHEAVLGLFQQLGGFDSMTVHRDYAGLPRVLQAGRNVATTG
jgi:release factor glutamine methyltransferase